MPRGLFIAQLTCGGLALVQTACFVLQLLVERDVYATNSVMQNQGKRAYT